MQRSTLRTGLSHWTLLREMDGAPALRSPPGPRVSLRSVQPATSHPAAFHGSSGLLNVEVVRVGADRLVGETDIEIACRVCPPRRRSL